MQKKKDKTPRLLKFIRWAYPKVEVIAPPLAYRFFIRLFFTPLKYRATEKERKAETFGVKFSITSEGKKIQCCRWGSSDKTIIVVHGWAGRATQFRRFVKPFLAAGYQVIGFDGPAHGQSEGRSTDLDGFKAVIEKLVAAYPTSAIVAHSFGGVASLYALAGGLPVKTLVNIASPTMGEEIIDTYRHAIGASAKAGEAFKKYVLKKSGKTFDEFSALSLIKHVPPDLNLLLVHDENDREVDIKQPKALHKQFPQASLYVTEGLGHTRILKDNRVIGHIVTFVAAHTSG